MAKIGLDLETFRQTADNMQGAYVRGPGGDNAIPTMVMRKFIGETATKIVRLANIYRIPAKRRTFAEDVHPRSNVVDGADCVVLGFVSRSGNAVPHDEFEDGLM